MDKKYEAQMMTWISASHGELLTWVALNSKSYTLDEAQQARARAVSLGHDRGQIIRTRIVVVEVVE